MGSCSSCSASKSGYGARQRSNVKSGKEMAGRTSSKVSYATLPSTCKIEEGKILLSSVLKSFCFNDLKEATENFSSYNMLGEGDFGSVFKGWIDEHSMQATMPESGMAVAVKVLRQKGCLGQQEWLVEIKYLGQLYHPNFVKLVGYCIEDVHRALVYEFMSNGSLDKHLVRLDFNGVEYNYNGPLSWNHRIKVALGAAKALTFLHDVVKTTFRDFRASNILLDSNYNAKLCDFGLAKDVPATDGSHFTASRSGTWGYSAPEFVKHGKITTKIDVYSFGVVLLELISGRAAVDEYRPSGEQVLVDWAKPILSSKRKIFQVFDACLEKKHEVSGALKTAILANLCLSPVPSLRPDMEEVVKALEQISEGIY